MNLAPATPNDETVRLRALLDERGIEYKTRDALGARETSWCGCTACQLTPESKLIMSLTPEQAVNATVGPKITEDTSDGYHTFNELYHHRALLFSVIVHDHRDMCWKSKMHDDRTMYDGMFIVGIDTPWGQASYHYDMEYWDMFDCKALERAPKYDGYTPDESVARIARLVELDNGGDRL